MAVTTRQVVPQTQRNAGTYTSPNIDLEAGVIELRATMTMPSTELSNVDNSVVYQVDGSFDSGQSWQLLVGSSWVGGPPIGQAPFRDPPTCRVNTTPMPVVVRATVTTNRRWSWGVELVTTTAE
jgi:hypothetical protein